jgi:hypothetical protein
MLSSTSRQEILRKIGAQLGYQVTDADLSPEARRAVTSLATIQRNLSVVSELLKGETGRVDRSLVLRAASKVGLEPEAAERSSLRGQMAQLQKEVDAKVLELSSNVLPGQKGTPTADGPRKEELVALKCPQCGASLPLPTGRLFKCEYCGATLSFQDVTEQLTNIIRGL